MEGAVSVPLYSLIPFAIMLGSIAFLPLVAEHWWEKNLNKLFVALGLAIPTGIYLVAMGFSHELIHSLVFDYVPFIILLGSLYVITGGIFVDGDIEASPRTNSIFLGIGAVLASIMGTTGAAMLLIRPVLQTNKERKFKVHTVLFFIAVVANCGGLLTPLGDPPLFLLYLRGAPFTWFFGLLPEWLFVNVALIIIYFFVDSFYYKKEDIKDIQLDKTAIKPISLEGKINFLWLVGVVLSVAFINEQYIPAIKENHYIGFIREAVILTMGFLSLKLTPKQVRQANVFSWHPIEEVAFLFIGIFTTMVPCIEYLKINAGELGITTHQQFYYLTGGLSAVLDNAPTAVTFYYLALGAGMQDAVMVAGVPDIILKSISVAAVFFGAMTYIGNGPNFMVKAVAEQSGVTMPSFFGYVAKFSLIVLLPLYILSQILFL